MDNTADYFLGEATEMSEIKLDDHPLMKMRSDENSFNKSQRPPVEQDLAPEPAALDTREQENFAGFRNQAEMMQGESLRFLVVGRTGSGKSSTGNSILGQKIFSVEMGSSSVTKTCRLERNKRNGVNIEVMDSPGLFDTSKTHEEVATDVVQAVACMHPGPTAVLYVISLANRYTQEENGVYERLKALLDKHVTEYMIVVFTRRNELNQHGKTIQDFLSTAPPELCKVLEECNDRHVVFENFADDKDSQVDDLLQMVRTLNETNGGKPYTCPKYGEVGKKMNKEVERRLKKLEMRESKRKKFVQDLEMMMKETQEQTEMLRKELKREVKNRAEQRKMSSLGREEKLAAILEVVEKQKLSYEAGELRNLLCEMESEKNKEIKDGEQFWKVRIEVLEKQTKEIYDKRIEEALEEERKLSKMREEGYEKQLQNLKDTIAKRCVIL